MTIESAPPTGSAAAAEGAPPVSSARRPELHTVARGGALNLAGAATNGLLSFLLITLITRAFAPGIAGIYFQGIAVVTIATNFLLWGADVGMVRWVSAYRALGLLSRIRKTFLISLMPAVSLAIVLAALGFVFAPHIVPHLTKGTAATDATTFFRILVVALPVIVAYEITAASTRGFSTMVPSLVIDKISKPGGQLVLSLIATVAGFGLAALAVAFVVPSAVGLVACVVWVLVLLRRVETESPPLLSPHDSLPSGVASTFWRFALPRGLAGIFQVTVLWLDTLLLGVLRTPKEAAIYTSASRFIPLGSLALQAVSQAMAPEISRLFALGKRGEARDVYQTTTAWIVSLAWPMFLSLGLFAPFVLRVFGHRYAQGASVLFILSLVELVAMATGPVDWVLLMAGKSTWNLYNTLLALVLNVGLNLVLIPRYGMVGAAFAWAASILANNIAPVIEVWLLMDLYPFGRGFLVAARNALAVFAVLGIVVRLTLGHSGPAFALYAIVGGGIYVVLLWRSRRVLEASVMRRALRSRFRGPGSNGDRTRRDESAAPARGAD